MGKKLWFEVAVVAKVQADSLDDAKTAVVRRLSEHRAYDESVESAAQDIADAMGVRIQKDAIVLLLANDIETDSKGRRLHILHPATTDLDSYIEHTLTQEFLEGDSVSYKHNKRIHKGKIVQDDEGLHVVWSDTPSVKHLLDVVLSSLAIQGLTLEKE
jgi:hypothetical protein